MRTLFTFLAVACSVVAMAQGNVKISGTVVDSVANKPVEFATVALTDPATNKALDGTICDDKGAFTINKVAPGDYIISITFIGFVTKKIPVKIDDKKDINLGKITISPVAQVLKEVVVEGERSLIEERVDRTVYNAENDATAKGGDATDVLKRVPMLSVDMDGNVSLRGNQNILVLINNKPSTIVASSVADALKQIPADQIKTVEVITSPSAKYDAEGSAGIINIVTKKNTLEGVTLNVDAGAGYRGSNLGLNGSYRKGKMGFTLGGFGRAQYNVNGSFASTQITTDTAEHRNLTTTTIQQANSRSTGLFGNYNLGWDYDINEKNSLAASVRFGVRNNNSYQDGLNTTVNDALNKMQNTINKNHSNNVDANLTYTHLYAKPQRELSLQALFSRNNGNTNLLNITNFAVQPSVPYGFKNLNTSYNQEITLQADYQSPIGSMQMVEFGGKEIMRRAVSDFRTFQAQHSDDAYQESLNTNYSNNLNYNQTITAGYLSYTLNTKPGYSIKAGTRYEYTTIDAFTKTESNIRIPSYGVMVPSVNVSKKLKAGNMLKASYNRRIQRPSIRYLNPNIQQQNPTNVTIGNPQLSPEYTNNFELAYSTYIKGTTLNFSGFYRNTNNAIQSLRDVLSSHGAGPDTIRTRYKNIGLEDAYGMSIFANVSIGKLSLNGGTDIYYAYLDNRLPADSRIKNQGWVASGRVFGSYTLTKGWGFQFFSFVRGRQVQLQGTQGGFYMYSLALRKEFNEKRGSVGIGAENFLQKGIKIRTNLESPILSQHSLTVMNNMNFRINFSYRIGKMSMDQKQPRRRRSINNDDLKEGGEGDSGGQMGGGQMGGGGNQQMQMNGGQRFPGAQGGQNNANKPAAQTQAPTPTDGTVYEAAGTWTYTIDSPQGGNGTLVIKKENGVYSGTIKSDRMREETALSSITVNGNQVTMTYNVNFGGNAATVEIKATINNNDMNGTLAFGQFRTFNLAGKRSQ